MNHSKKTFILAQTALRHFSKTAPKNADTEVVAVSKFKRLKELQKRFGIEDNVPVYLKGGVFDKLLYQATCVITFVGVGLSLQVFYDLAWK